MEEPAIRHYNLRSGNHESYSLPVQLHLSDDFSHFLSDLLTCDRANKTGQVSDTESSISESDCEALISSSSHVSQTSKVKSSNSESEPTSSQSGSMSQHDINVQILSQLQLLGWRLDQM